MSEDFGPREEGTHTVAIFAGRIPGQDKGWNKVIANAGALCARNGWRIIVLADGANVCRPLLEAARQAGAAVMVVGTDLVDAQSLPEGAVLETVEDEEERLQRVSDLVDGFLVLPTTLTSIREMYKVWVLAGGGSSGRPVAMLNRHRAFEVFRGYTQDVLNSSIANLDRLLMFADTLDELVPRLQKVLDMHA